MDDIIQNLQPQYELLSKKIVNTVRGKELRLVLFMESGSPIASQRLEGGKLTEKKQLNMIAASTLFLSVKDNDVIEIVAGVTQDMFGETGRTRKEDQEHLTKMAEENLEKFLEGIVIK